MARKGYADVLEKDPTKGVSQEEKIGRTSQKLGESERRAIREQVDAAEDELRKRKELSGSPDLSDVKEEIRKKKMILQHDDDLTPKTGMETDRLAKRAEEIEYILKKEMPTRNEMWPKHGSVEAQKALRHNLKFQAERSDLCREWQEIQKKLQPDDPYAASLETIRPE
jgi:hypothetical protein